MAILTTLLCHSYHNNHSHYISGPELKNSHPYYTAGPKLPTTATQQHCRKTANTTATLTTLLTTANTPVRLTHTLLDHSYSNTTSTFTTAGKHTALTATTLTTLLDNRYLHNHPHNTAEPQLSTQPLSQRCSTHYPYTHSRTHRRTTATSITNHCWTTVTATASLTAYHSFSYMTSSTRSILSVLSNYSWLGVHMTYQFGNIGKFEVIF